MRSIQAVITQESAVVSCNFEQVKEAVQERLAQYEGAEFTEESKVFAKKEVASLRAEKRMFQDNLRSEKKKYMGPWENFEKQAKELISLYDKPIELINGQVQAFEEKRVAEKKQLIADIYAELIPEGLKEYLPLDRIYNPKWENATMTKKKISEYLSGLCESTRGAVDTICGMNSEAVDKALEMYKRDLSLSGAVTYINNYERQKQEILERRRREDEERIRREEREKLLAEQRAQAEKEAVLKKAEEEKAAAVERAKEEAAQEVIEGLTPKDIRGTETYTYKIALSEDAKDKLEMYMDSIGIEWELI